MVLSSLPPKIRHIRFTLVVELGQLYVAEDTRAVVLSHTSNFNWSRFEKELAHCERLETVFVSCQAQGYPFMLSEHQDVQDTVLSRLSESFRARLSFL